MIAFGFPLLGFGTPSPLFSQHIQRPAHSCVFKTALGFGLAFCTPEAYSLTVFTFIESSIFERVLPVYLDDDEYSDLQQSLMQNPEAGEVVPGSGGVRKVRWSRPGTGKRGGLRIIYFVRYRPNEIWMLTLYAKAKRENVPAHILKQLLEAFRNG